MNGGKTGTKKEEGKRSRAWGPRLLTAGALLGLTFGNVLFFRSDPAFLSVNPNPFFLLVAAVAYRGGLRAALVTSLWTFLVNLFVLPLTHTVLLYDFLRSGDLHTLWGGIFLGALILGGLADSLRLRCERFELMYENTIRRFREFDCSYQLLEHAKEELEGRVRAFTDSATTIFDDVRRLSGLERRRLLTELVHLFCKYGRAEQVAAWSVKPKGFRLEAEVGHTELLRPMIAAREAPILTEAVTAGKTVTVRGLLDRGEAAAESSGTLIAVPVPDADGEATAVIAVDDIPFIHFNRRTLNVMALLCEWAGLALQEGDRITSMKERGLYDDTLGVFREEYLLERLREEAARSVKYKLPLSLVAVLTESEAARARAARILRREVRVFDALALSDSFSGFFVLLPMTSAAGARAFIRRMRRRIEEKWGAEIRFRVADLSERDPEQAVNAIRGVRV